MTPAEAAFAIVAGMRGDGLGDAVKVYEDYIRDTTDPVAACMTLLGMIASLTAQTLDSVPEADHYFQQLALYHAGQH